MAISHTYGFIGLWCIGISVYQWWCAQWLTMCQLVLLDLTIFIHNWDQVESQQEFELYFPETQDTGKVTQFSSIATIPMWLFTYFFGIYNWFLTFCSSVYQEAPVTKVSSSKLCNFFWIWVLAYYLLMLKLWGKVRQDSKQNGNLKYWIDRMKLLNQFWKTV